jgi:cell wall-associated NlpC family hydrolase
VTTRLVAVAAACLLVPVIVVVLLLGGLGNPASALGLSAALNGAAIPNPAWIPWVVQAGSMCAPFTPPIIAAQIDQESGWNPNAVSPAGAEGIAQFLPGTWASWGQDNAGDGNVTPFNVPDAIMAMGRFDCALAEAVTPIAAASGQPVLTLALDAYNAGLGAVQAADGVPANPETEAYAPSIEQKAARYARSVPSTQFAAAEIAAAESQIGLPYVWGGGDTAGPTAGGFDCSGLVLYAVYQASGGAVTLPHLSEAQVMMGNPVAAGMGAQMLGSGQLAPGDVIGFYNLDGDNQWDHIGIYIGDGQMVDAPSTGQTVRIEHLTTGYWENVPWTVRSFG